MMRFIKRLFFVSTAAILLTGGYLVWDIQRFLHQPVRLPAQGIIFEIKPGANLTRVAHQLGRQGVLSQPRYLIWYARWYRLNDTVHIGEYNLTPGSTPKSLLDQFTSGKVIQYSLTIVEGWSFSQIINALAQAEHVQHQLQGFDHAAIMQRLGYPGEHPEGRFLPDTYFYPRGTSDIVVLQRAYQAMQRYLDQVWPTRAAGLPIKTPYEALILASIVEKETGLARERGTIAGVFTRRLQQRMRLQSDPTVIYGMGERFDGNIRKRDLETVTPYNTYRIYGLPPTPIAMPSKQAIAAVLQPEPGNALYFVSKGDGSHVFSDTLDEHNRAVIQYQLKGRARPFSSYPSAPANGQRHAR